MSLRKPEPAPASVKDALDMRGKVGVITGGAGLLGLKHAETIAEFGAIPILVDIRAESAKAAAALISERYGVPALGAGCDITCERAVSALHDQVLAKYGRVDILINNATNNPKVESATGAIHFSRLENFPLAQWQQDIAIGLTGAFLCSRVFGPDMAAGGKGVILNIASDLGIIAPDQRLYSIPGIAPDAQPVKPVTYSIVKAGLIGLTRYLATYWPGRVRANALAPGGVYAGQPDEFLARLNALIPMGRMAHEDEYKGAVAFLVSDASSYMNGGVLSVDGGRTAW